LVLLQAAPAAASDAGAMPPSTSSVAAVPASAAPVLTGLLVLSDPKAVLAEGTPAVKGVEVRGIEVLDTAGFKALLAARLGARLTDENRAGIVEEIVRFLRGQARAVADVSLPPQEITGGVLQVLVLQGKVGEVRVEGGRWFSPGAMAGQIGAQSGQDIDARKLLGDIDWLNRNPFRQVNLVYAKGAEFGQTDLVLQEIERFPLRVFAGYDDSGTPVTGNERLTAGLTWGSVFGGDGQLNYQYTADPGLKWFRAHSASLIQPLPWRHTMTVFGSYADTHGNLPQPFDLKGFNWQAGLRYEVPLPKLSSARLSYQEAVVAGFDFKRSNSNLAFGGEQVFGTLTDGVQWTLGYNSSLKDPWGSVELRATLACGPGRWTANDTDAAYQQSRAGARSRYTYGKLEANRTTGLPFDFTLVTQLIYQKTDSNLLATEQLGFGGYDTIRGYDTRVVNGDQGYIVTNELRAPPLGVLSRLRLKGLDDKLQFLGFFDYGYADNRDLLPGEAPHTILAGAGPGVRYAVSTYLSLRADYGWQLHNAQGQRPYSSRSHLGLTVSY
jgi:hemolysin activation/secretion protein